MANNENWWVCFCTPTNFIVLLVIFLLMSTSSGIAQNISKHYTSSMQDEGVLYFIFSKSGFKNNKMKSKLNYDITYFSANDSATLNFSYFDKSIRTIDSLLFTGSNKTSFLKAKKIFIETKHKKWHHRYSLSVAFKDLDTLFSQAEKPVIILYTQQGIVELTIKAKTWKKHSSVLKKTFVLIKYN